MKLSGIYKIQSIIKPQRIYIGSAVNIAHRWSMHLSDLKLNKHASIKLQRHYNKYSKVDLQFSILLGCEKEDLLKTEQYFLDSYNPYFNTCKIAGSSFGLKRGKPSELTLIKLRKSHKGERLYRRIPILQFDKQGNFIREWTSASHAAKELSILAGQISNCLGGQRRSYKGYQWKYKNRSVEYQRKKIAIIVLV